MKKYIKYSIIASACAVISVMAISHVENLISEENEEEIEFSTTPLIIENKGKKEDEEFAKSISREVENILNGDIILSVYSNGTEDFCYYGKAELINDGSDGTEVILIIHEDKRVSLDSVF